MENEVEPKVHDCIVRVCQACIDLKGQECHVPECVFCFKGMDEAKWLLDKMLICPIIDGVRYILAGDVVEDVSALAESRAIDPCKYCSSTATAMQNPETKRWWIECDGCGISTPTDNFSNPYEVWNTRVTPSSPLTAEQAKEKSAVVNGLLWNQLTESIEYIRNDEVHDAALRIVKELRRVPELMAVATKKESS